jgi:septal ring factor EnvC (AmiA/AmiB activator)
MSLNSSPRPFKDLSPEDKRLARVETLKEMRRRLSDPKDIAQIDAELAQAEQSFNENLEKDIAQIEAEIAKADESADRPDLPPNSH